MRRFLPAGLAFVCGLALGYYLYRPGRIPVESRAPEQNVPGGKILERDPERRLPPPPVIPRGAKIERQVQVVVEAKTPGSVEVDLTLLRLSDGSHRVEVTSPDGTILRGVDVPMVGPPAPKILKWAIGGIYGPQERGVFVDRDFGPFRTGAEVVLRRERDPPFLSGTEWRVKAGIRF